MTELLKHLPEKTRARLYVASLIAGLAIGATNVAYLTATGDLPAALAVINAVALFLGVPITAGTARANLATSTSVTIIEPPDEDREFDNADSPQNEAEDR